MLLVLCGVGMGLPSGRAKFQETLKSQETLKRVRPCRDETVAWQRLQRVVGLH